MTTEIDVEQGTLEWHMARLGKVTASRIADMLAETKSGWGASRTNYMVELATERLTKSPRMDSYKSADMVAGSEAEPLAREAYEFMYGVEIEKCGFFLHPTIGEAGCSPDGLVGASGLVEIKCPILATHQATLLGASIQRQYQLQRQWQLACTGRQWCDYISYLDPKRWPEPEFDRRNMRLFVHRTHRDNAKIADIERETIKFLEEVRSHHEKLDRRFPAPDAPPELQPDNVLMGG